MGQVGRRNPWQMPRRLRWWERPRNRLLLLGLVGLLAGIGVGILVVPRLDTVPEVQPPQIATAQPSGTASGRPPPRVEVLPDRPEPPPLPYFDEDAAPSIPAIRRSIGFCRGRSGNDCVIDGDTFILAGETIRLAGIDAPEMGNPGCEDERRLAEAAKNRLHRLLNTGAIQLVATGDRDRDRYGRLLRDAHVDGRSVSEALMAEGLARPWRGRRESWC
jgi:micrococcal nuclease